VPALASGVGLALSLPPWGFWILAFPSAALLWWRLDGLRMRTRFLAGWSAGLGLFVPGLWWVTSFNVYGGIVLMLVESLAPAVACAVVARRGRGRTLVLAGAMVLVEAVRGTWPFGGLPLGGVALGQAAGPLAGAARLGGPLLLVGLIWLTAGALATVVVTAARFVGYRRDRRRAAQEHARQQRSLAERRARIETDEAFEDRPPLRALAAASRRVRPPRPVRVLGPLLGAATILGVVVGSAWWGAVAPDGGPALATIRVASVQGGGVRGLRQAQVAPATVYAAQVAATAEIPRHDGGIAPTLIVWPEDVVDLSTPLAQSPAQAALGAIASGAHATLVVGITEDVSATAFRNEVVAFAPSGHVVARFEKVHRVPFGEYVPYRGFFSHLASLSEVPRDAIPGHGDGMLVTPAARLGVMVSYEIFYPARGRVATRAGAQLLVDPTNTSSYLTSQVPTQEIAAARLQAIAEGRDLVQSAPTGFSAFVDHRGHVLVRSTLAVRQVLVRDVALRGGSTLYERGGDLPVLGAAGVLVVVGLAAALTDDDHERAGRARRERRRRAPRGRHAAAR